MEVTRRCGTMLHLITTHTQAHSSVAHVWGYVSGHGDGDDEKEVEEYVKAEIRWRWAAIRDVLKVEAKLLLDGS